MIIFIDEFLAFLLFCPFILEFKKSLTFKMAFEPLLLNTNLFSYLITISKINGISICFLNHHVLTNLRYLKRLFVILNPLLVFQYCKTSLMFLVSMPFFKLLFGMTINTFLFGHFTRTFSNPKTEYFVNLTRHLFQQR